MIVSCPSCDKKYKLDDAKVKDGGVKIKCTGCETVFAVRPQASARLFKVRCQDGSELGPFPLTELILNIQMGKVTSQDKVAGNQESYIKAADHPDLDGVKFKDPKPVEEPSFSTADGESTDEDDLFGGGGDTDDDLFGGGSDAGISDESDDLFGADEGAGKTANDEDDLFGDSGASPEEDDLFGTAESNSDNDDDLFGDAGASDSASIGTSEENDLFGSDDDDMFADSAPAPAVDPGSGGDDLFGDDSEQDEDLFGSDDEMFDNTPAPKAQKAAQPTAADDLFSDDEDDDLFGSDDSDDNEGDVSDDAIFGTDEEEDNSFEDQSDFASDQTGDNFAYDEDIDAKVSENPLENDGGAGLFTGDMEVEEGIDDLITAPLDLPDSKRSKLPLILSLLFVLILGGSAGAIYFLPAKLAPLPGIGSAVEGIHKSLKTGWYIKKQGAHLTASLAELPSGMNIIEIRSVLETGKNNQEVLAHSPEAAEIVGIYALVARLSSSFERSELSTFAVIGGLPGAILKMIDSPANIPPQPTSWNGLLEAYSATLQEKIEKALAFKVNQDASPEVQFAGYLLMAKIQKDLGAYLKVVEHLESAGIVFPKNRFTKFLMADILYKNLNRKTEALVLLADIPEGEGHPTLQANILTLRAYIALGEEDYKSAIALADRALSIDENIPAAAAIKADLLNRTGNAIEALKLVAEYAQRYPKHFDIKLQEGIAKELLGRQKEAIEVYQTAEALSDVRYEATLHKATLLATTGEIEEAFTIINELVSKYPDNPMVLMGKGSLYLEKREYDKAEKLLRMVLEKQPDQQEALLAMGRLKLATHELVKAEELFTDANRLDPVHRVGKLEMGIVYLAQNKTKKSEEIFNSILEEQPQNAVVLLSLGKIAYKRKQYKDAIEFVNEALKHQSNLHEGYYYLSLAESQREDYTQAILDLKKAISLKPDPKYRLALAETYAVSGKPGMGIEVYDEILSADPDNKDALWGNVRLYLTAGEDDKALKGLERLGSLDKRNPELFHSFAEVYRRKYELEKGLKKAVKGLKIAKNDISLLQVAGLIALQMGKYSLARKYLSRARSLSPKNGYTRYLLGRYYKEGQNDLGKAAIRFEAAIKLGLSDPNVRAQAEDELKALKYR